MLDDLKKLILPLEYRILFAKVKKISSDEAFFKKHQLNSKEQAKLIKLIEQRIQGKPIAKIVQNKEFYGINFKTNSYTLDPRPDSEIMIDAIKYFFKSDDYFYVCDIGTGTANLLLCTLLEFKNSKGIGIDISKRALNVANYNLNNLANKHDSTLIDRATIINNNLLNKINNKFDLIVSNPPYIDKNEILSISTRYDPDISLFAKDNGLYFYKKIIKQAKKNLNPKGLLFFELGINQLNSVSEHALKHGFKFLKTFDDLSSVARIACYQLYSTSH